MLLMRNLSFRYKIPLRAAVLVVLTALSVTGAILVSEYDNVRKTVFASGETLAGVLTETLREPLRHDDVWRSYEIIRAPLALPEAGASLAVIVDPLQRVFVSSRPEEVRMQTPISVHGQELERVADVMVQAEREWTSGTEKSQALKIVEADHYYVIAPVLADGLLLGSLILRYPKDMHWPRFIAIGERAGWITLGVLLLLLPLSWFWGQRMAQPMVDLAHCIRKAGRRIPEESECRLYESQDELGQLSHRLREMFVSLREKEALERQMMSSERLAAIGRLAAGIAHEVNNPLGGMLNAISTHRKHGTMNERTARTLDMLERGLEQIRDTVSALLVEARPGSGYLSVEDVNDVRMLVLPGVQQKAAHLGWDVEMADSVALPATLVRQVLINLLLNATHAAGQGGRVEMQLRELAGRLEIRIGNDGDHIPPEKLEQLFEPFQDMAIGDPLPTGGRQGMGLWITYQIVRQLGGRVDVESRPGWTVVQVSLPVHGMATVEGSGEA